MEKHSNCTSKVFKKDISELCDKCPLVNIIQQGIENQIVSQVKERQELLTPQQFKSYLNDEVANAQAAMQRVDLVEKKSEDDKADPYRNNRSEIYIWNKERIKALNQFLMHVTVLSGKTQLILEEFEKHKLSNFVKTKGFEYETIMRLINENSGRELMPFTIALLYEIKYLDYFQREYCRSRTEADEKLAKIFSCSSRQIKGNHNILRPDNKETGDYSSHLYTKDIQKALKGL